MTAFLEQEDFGDLDDNLKRIDFFGVMLSQQEFDSLSHNLAFSDLADEVLPSCPNNRE
jgi:hypothetical protein